MEVASFSIFLILLFILTLYLSNTFAQDYTQLGLPEGAKMRLGKGEMTAIEYSRDGTHLAVASSIGIWWYDTSNGQESLFTTYTDWVSSMAFSPDGGTLAGVSAENNAIFLWNVSTRTIAQKFTGYDGRVTRILFSPDGQTLASVERGGKVLLWDVSTGTIKWTLMHSESVNSISFSPDGEILASGGYDGILFWDITTGTIKQKFITDPRRERTISFSPDGKTLASAGCPEDEILLWDITTGTIKQKFTSHGFSFQTKPFSISFSPNGQTLAIGSSYSTCLWDISTGTVKREYFVGYALFSPDGKRLVGISRNSRSESTLEVWDVLSGKLERMIRHHTTSFSRVSFSPDGQTLMVDSTSHLFPHHFLWDVSTGKLKHEEYVPVSFSPDGQTLAVGPFSLFHLWDVFRSLIRGISPITATGIGLSDISDSTREHILIHRKYVNSILFSPDGRTLASADAVGTIRLWDVLKGKTKQKFKQKFRSYSLSFSPDGRTLASAGDDGNLWLWDLLSRKVKQKLTGHKFRVRSVLFSPDGQTLASIDGYDHSIWLWDVLSGTVKLKLRGPFAFGENIMSFSPDGKMLASVSHGMEVIHLSDVSTGAVKQDLIEHTKSVQSVSFSPDNKVLASGHWDGTVLLWDVSTGTITHEFIGHTHWVESVSFSPDGRMLASGSLDGTVLLWDLPSL